MRIANRTNNLIAFKVTLPSKRVFRLEIGGGELIDVSNAVAIGLEDHQYFNELKNSNKLEVIEPKTKAKANDSTDDAGN